MISLGYLGGLNEITRSLKVEEGGRSEGEMLAEL